MIQLSYQLANILIDYTSIKGIIKYTLFNIIDLIKANLKLANTINELSYLEFNIVYIPREFNILLNILLYLLTFKKEIARDTNSKYNLIDIQFYLQNAYNKQAFIANEAFIEVVISKELKS